MYKRMDRAVGLLSAWYRDDRRKPWYDVLIDAAICLTCALIVIALCGILLPSCASHGEAKRVGPAAIREYHDVYDTLRYADKRLLRRIIIFYVPDSALAIDMAPQDGDGLRCFHLTALESLMWWGHPYDSTITDLRAGLAIDTTMGLTHDK